MNVTVIFAIFQAALTLVIAGVSLWAIVKTTKALTGMSKALSDIATVMARDKGQRADIA